VAGGSGDSTGLGNARATHGRLPWPALGGVTSGARSWRQRELDAHSLWIVAMWVAVLAACVAVWALVFWGLWLLAT
jgi:hypothetical protein